MTMSFRARFFVIASFFFISIRGGSDPSDGIVVQGIAREWIASYLAHKDGSLAVNAHDLAVILNVLYFSYARSRATLDVQEHCLFVLEQVWHILQNVIQTRLDPAHAAPYSPDPSTVTELADLLELQTQHRRVGLAYAVAIDKVFKGGILTDKTLIDALNEVRAGVRGAITHALADVREHLELLINARDGTNNDAGAGIASASVDDIGNDLDATSDKGLIFGQYLASLLGHLAVDTFVKADRLIVDVSQNGWYALSRVLVAGNHVWKAVEMTRVRLYYAYYSSVWAFAQTQGIEPSTVHMLFDENGLIDDVFGAPTLPNPENLSTDLP